MIELSPAERRTLKQRAHHLNPVVTTGNAGITPAVLAEMVSSLAHHELMKIRVMADDRDERRQRIADICRHLDAALVQQVGFMATLYRPNPEKQREAERARKALARKKPDNQRAAPRAGGREERYSRSTGSSSRSSGRMSQGRSGDTPYGRAPAGRSRPVKRSGPR